MNAVKLPLDLFNLPPFRELRELLGTSMALLVWYEVYRELAYQAENGGMVGKLPTTATPGLIQELGKDIPSGEYGLESLVEDLVRIKFLVPEADGYVCPRFISEHPDAGRLGTRSAAQRGGDLRAFSLGVRRAEEQSAQLAMSLPPDRYKDAQGNPIDADTMKRVMMLITMCDRALFKNQRAGFSYREAIIHAAVKVLREFTEEQINLILRTIAGKRGHPFLANATTEKVLPDFGGILKSLGMEQEG